MSDQTRRAFTLVEILIVVVILGVLAAIVIPLFTNASTDAQRASVMTELKSIRNQIELYRAQHGGTSPVMAGSGPMAFSQLVTPPLPQSPYMRTAPANPRNGSTTVGVDASPTNTATSLAAALMDPMASGAPGWIYNQNTGGFACVGFDEGTMKWFGEP
jgi:general secretion pathway protein G